MRTVKTRRIYPSGRLAGVTREISKNDAVFSVMSEACELLRDRTGESVLCGQIEEGFVRVIAFIEGLHPLRYASAGGDKLSLHVSALGKAILAIGSPEEAKRQLRMKPLKKLAPDTITEIESLEIQIEDIRKQGWALVENEGGEDLAAMAVAGFINREPFAISIAGPVGRLRLNRDEYLKALREVQALLFEDATQ
jgi:DNA-binding IclR family transcriptional regulator